MPEINIHKDQVEALRKTRDLLNNKSGQNKAVVNIMEKTEGVVFPAVILSFVGLARILSLLSFPFLFYGDYLIKQISNLFKLTTLWQSEKPLPVKILITVANIAVLTLFGGVISVATKPVAVALAGALGPSAAALAMPVLITTTLTVATGFSLYGTIQQYRDLKNHPWKKTEIQSAKLQAKVVKTSTLFASTAIVWPMLKFGLVPVLTAKAIALSPTPAGWAAAGLLAVIGVGALAHKAYTTYKIHKHQRKTARALVDTAIEPETILDVDIEKIKANCKETLTTEFNTKYPKIFKNKDTSEYQNKLNNYLYKGNAWSKIKQAFGGGTPIGRAVAKSMKDEVANKFNEAAKEILVTDQTNLYTIVKGITDYKFNFKKRPFKEKMSLEEKMKIAIGDYVKYGKCRYEVFEERARTQQAPQPQDNAQPQDQKNAEKKMTWFGRIKIMAQLERDAKQSEFRSDPKIEKLKQYYEQSEVLSNNYARDHYLNYKELHQYARDERFNPYQILNVSLNATEREVKRAYEEKIKSTTPEDEINIKQAYFCIGKKKNKDFFDVTFATSHQGYHLTKIVRVGNGNVTDNDSNTINLTSLTNRTKLNSCYKETKENLKKEETALKAKDKNKENNDKLTEIQNNLDKLKWAYRLLKNSDHNKRFEANYAVKKEYDTKLDAYGLNSPESSKESNSSSYKKLLVIHPRDENREKLEKTEIQINDVTKEQINSIDGTNDNNDVPEEKINDVNGVEDIIVPEEKINSRIFGVEANYRKKTMHSYEKGPGFLIPKRIAARQLRKIAEESLITERSKSTLVVN